MPRFTGPPVRPQPDREDRPFAPPTAQLGGSPSQNYGSHDGAVLVSQSTGIAAGRRPGQVHVGDGMAYSVSAKGVGRAGQHVRGYVPPDALYMVSGHSGPQGSDTTAQSVVGRVHVDEESKYMVSASGKKGVFQGPANPHSMGYSGGYPGTPYPMRPTYGDVSPPHGVGHVWNSPGWSAGNNFINVSRAAGWPSDGNIPSAGAIERMREDGRHLPYGAYGYGPQGEHGHAYYHPGKPPHALHGHARRGTVNVSDWPGPQVSLSPPPSQLRPRVNDKGWKGPGIPPWKHYGAGDVSPPHTAVSGYLPNPRVSDINVSGPDAWVFAASFSALALVAGFALAGGFKRPARPKRS